MTFCLSAPTPARPQEAQEDIRRSVLAGTWYPRATETLQKQIHGYLSDARVPDIPGSIQAVLVPHAGYRYSGFVAAHAYRLLQGAPYRRVILVGPSHRPFPGVSVNLQSAYETPLGLVPVEKSMAKRIQNASPKIGWVKQAHAVEHSLEIQLPFLQTVLGDFEIVPILMGQQDYETCLDLSHALVRNLQGVTDTLLLASTDLSHFHPYEEAKVLDERFQRRIRQLDPRGLWEDLHGGVCEACGGGAVITVLEAAMGLGADRSVILRYANSGDVTGDHSRVVGYLAAALISAR